MVTADPDPPPFTVVDADLTSPGWSRPRTSQRVADVRVAGGRIVAIGRDLAGPGDRLVHARGAALLPGLHDHHLHLLAMAAARRSTDVAACADPAAFDAAVIRAAHGAVAGSQGWIRVVGLDDHHGPLDRQRLDRLVPDRPVRVQHRSGAAWVLNSRALVATGSVEVAPDGWLHRADDGVATRWADGDDAPDLRPIARRLAAAGVTGVTDATPATDLGSLTSLARARRSGALPQRVLAMGGPRLAGATFPPELERGPVKVVISDHALPSIPDLVASFGTARRAGRPVAVHCVTRVALVLALAAWSEVGAVPGDRIEHGSVVPLELVTTVAELGVTVVTQPGFVHARGDRYLREVEPDDVGHLYRCGSLLAAGVGVGASTDAPFGPDDPWLAIATMTTRRTRSGRRLGEVEAVEPETALARFLSDPVDPGGPPRTVHVGAPADLVLLDRPLGPTLDDLHRDRVATTWVGGTVVHGDPGC